MKKILLFSILSFLSILAQDKDRVIDQNALQIESNFNPNEHRSNNFLYPVYFEPQNYQVNASYGLKAPGGNLLQFWIELDYPSYLYLSISSNDGFDWSAPEVLQTEANWPQNANFQLDGVVTQTGRIILYWVLAYESSVNSRFYMIYSDDNGNTWSAKQSIGTGLFAAVGKNGSLKQSDDGTLWFTYNKSNNLIFYRTSTDNGITWSSESSFQFSENPVPYGSIFSIENQKLGMVYRDKENSDYKINLRTSSDNGVTWSVPENIYSDTAKIFNLKTIKTLSADIYVVFQNSFSRSFNLQTGLSFDYDYNDILYLKSTNAGNSWSFAENFTIHKGFDGEFGLGTYDDKPYVSFLSSRFHSLNTRKLWLGVIGLTNDLTAPPAFIQYGIGQNNINIPIVLNAVILTSNPITMAQINYSINNNPQTPVLLYDDGLHNDVESNDDIWGNTIGPFDNPYTYISYSFTINDQAGNSIYQGGGYIYLFSILDSFYLFDINKIRIPILNNGIIADVEDDNITGGIYDEGRFLFSGGFLLSGISNGLTWTNGAGSSSHIRDYLPGNAGGTPPQSSMRLYNVSSNDPPFGNAWLDWSEAVDLGADFYDGDKDGFYNPVDLNNNGIWDPDEDRPGLIGNLTTFSVYNDAKPAELRRYYDVDPQGVEIQQTTYAFSNAEYGLDRTIFVKYKIINRGNSNWEDIYFSVYTDPDMGINSGIDLAGSDTLSNSVYVYKNTSDPAFGINPPSFFSSILQGPVVFIPGETFIDINGNEYYDEGIDTPIDTAYNIRGTHIGIDTIAGAKNLTPGSSMSFINGHPTMNDPGTRLEARNFMLGLDKTGNPFDPCTWSLSIVNGVNCNEINPKFMYSGNPETNIGWINNYPADVRGLINVGPFSLEQDSHTEIVTAYHVNRGSTGVNSVTAAKQSIQDVIEAYWNNFPVVVSVNDKKQVSYTYVLSQNYPNPFNPTTKIGFQISEPGNVSLKVYDVLGREVATLVNEEKPAGSYEIVFDASSLASGIYFYTLENNGFNQSKKMILLK